MKKANVVILGGGTGLSVLLRGLKTFPVDITAIVTVADDGGSSGRLRKELNIPPPGDVRNVLIALSEVEPLVEELFQHRFENGNGLTGHSLGNLLLAGMTSITGGDFARGVEVLSRVLNVKGKVLPAANQSIVLHAEMEDGSMVEGESKIPKAGKRIKRVFLEPENVTALADSVKAIQKADLVVIGPGSLYTSILPNLLVPGIAEAVKKAAAEKVYVCNVMTQPGETDHFSAGDHVQVLVDHVGKDLLDKVLVNTQPIPLSYAERYATEGATEVKVDRDLLKKLEVEIIGDELLYFDNYLLRHDAHKVSQRLVSML